MNEFKIESNKSKRNYDNAVRLTLSCLLIAFTTLAACLYMNISTSDPALLATSALGVIILSSILAFRELMNLAARQMVFVLEADAITRKRKGYADVRIRFSEIEAINEASNWLIINSYGARSKIAISSRIEGYEKLRSELVKHHDIARDTPFPFVGIILSTISVMSWGVVLWSHSVMVIVLAGCAALLTLAIATRKMQQISMRSGKRAFLLGPVVLAWAIAGALICIRIMKP
jgi:hypothetical protein